MKEVDFIHSQSAHCESGVCSNLLNHEGLNLSEAMAFGMGGGLFFGYLPFIRINGLPLVTYRATGRYGVKSPNCSIYKALFPEVLRLEQLRCTPVTAVA